MRPFLSLIGLLAFTTTAVGGQVKPQGPQPVPFDFHKHQIALPLIVAGETLRFLLDTGADPSAIDLGTARRLGLPLSAVPGAEGEGVGGESGPSLYLVEFRGAFPGGQDIGEIDTLAFDMARIGAAYGRPLHGVLGISFLRKRVVRVDYASRTVEFHPDRKTLDEHRNCARDFAIPLEFLAGDTIPRTDALSINGVSIPASIDTGSSGGIELFAEAVESAGLSGLREGGEAHTRTGVRGAEEVKRAVLPEAVFGPFTLTDVGVTFSRRSGSAATRLANIGNELLSRFDLVLDYQSGEILFGQGCARVMTGISKDRK